jgi:acetylornithine deacetylase/succinyl-diaminopimelate desuccinylase-like protein
LGARGDHIHSQAEFIYPESLVERAELLYVLLLELNERLGNGEPENPEL